MTALVIGYGDSLRSDDGAGPRVAELLSGLEGLTVLTRHQLVPELADDFRGRDVVVFVDAAATLKPGEVAVRRLRASPPAGSAGFTHHYRKPCSSWPSGFMARRRAPSW